jgi:2-aminobenzoate-CoA ligase
MLASADTYARHVLQLTPSDVCIGTTSLAWAFGLGALLTFPLRFGAATVLLDGPASLLQTIAAERATILFSVPTMYRMLLQHPDLDRGRLRSLRCCVSAAEPLPPDLLDAWRDRTGLDIVDGFGTTELTHIFISARPGSVRPGFIGTVVPGYEARIVDAEMRDVPDGTAGLLAVRGPTGARYWRDPAAQRRVVKNGWTLSGDRCVRHADGWFQHLGRADALVVSAGYKISTCEVEGVLARHPDVASARVQAIADPIRGAVTRAEIVTAAGADASGLAVRLQAYLKSEIAPFKCPREIRIIAK